ncbi:MAG TPA: carboxypeptidase-like regulatory domain-containing protein, partial [Chitinophagaceae bacterium]|nr:carboxypeptidase-like regulatory domain-containing protein [Chitinophagaceae bacterium]
MHAAWQQPLGLDTMAYYRFLFPGKNYRMVRTQISSTLIPQVSVYAVKNGRRQEIYLLYLNRELVYYNETNSYKPNAFAVYPGFAQIAFRLKDKYVEIDSVYMQPFYKQDISFDIDSLPTNARITPMPDTWTWQERELLEKSILRIESNSRNNNGYVWQNDRVEYLSETYRTHKAGPFRINDSIQFFKKYDFDFRFFYEPGYTYRITPKMVRMEKIPLFPPYEKASLPRIDTKWILGDTLMPVPEIRHDVVMGPSLEYVGGNNNNSDLYSRIMMQLPSRDTAIAYTILHQGDTAREYRVLWAGVDKIYGVKPGTYTLVLVTRNNRYIVMNDIEVTTKGTYCVDMRRIRMDHKNDFVETLQAMQKENRRIAAEAWERVRLSEQREENRNLYNGPRLNMQGGASAIKGVVRDEKGQDVIVSVSVYLKGYNLGTATNAAGEFSLSGIRAGRYVLVFASVGYESFEQAVTISEGQVIDVAVTLKQSEHHLEEVVVTGYGVQRSRKEIAYSVSAKTIDVVQGLQGKVAGLNITNDSGRAGADTKIMIRGISSLTANGKPLYIVDGVPMDQLPDGWDQSQVSGMEIMTDAAATSIWGSRAANGVIIITTKGFAAGALRKDFKDYAIWQPNLITDKNGEAKFAVTYPDNVTSWQTWVVGMDSKRRITRASKLVKAFKPLLAQLSTPQFLIAGDSATLIGKKINYTTSDMMAAVSFTVNDKQLHESSETIGGNNSSINELKIEAGSDTITARFHVKANGFADGEERKIPVFRKGTMETKGSFYILERDTSISFTADPLAGTITLLAQNNTFDLLLDEISQLNKYPYYCMEQIASKLTGLAMEKKIRTALDQPFKNEKLVQPLISRLQKGQRFDGGWAWWQEGEPSLYITNYITRALLEINDHSLLQTNIRNAMLYLQSQLPYMSRNMLLESLYTLSEAKHEMDYYIHLRKMPFDSLPQHQQWQIVSILQQQKMSYEKELNKLMAKKTPTMLGGLHWGDNNYYWERNAIATTVIAYKVLSRDGKYNRETQQVIQYFLEMKRGGYWRNTVEAATILSAIIPQKIKEDRNFTQQAALTISGDTSLSVTSFPFIKTIGGDKKQLSIQKSGGGMVYFTAWQELFNPSPTVVDSLFKINSYFKDLYNTITILKAGEKVMLKVEV